MAGKENIFKFSEVGELKNWNSRAKFVCELPTKEGVIAFDVVSDEVLGEQLYVFTETEIFRIDKVGLPAIKVW